MANKTKPKLTWTGKENLARFEERDIPE